jgi:hyperosmotically inducible protein
MKLATPTLALVIAAMGCHGSSDAESKNTDSVQAQADNTAKNDDSAALTAGDQGGSEADRGITQEIRRNVVAADGVSISGKNVKIITVDGNVTLRGPVKTATEKTDIERIAKAVPGVKRLDNQLEVSAN